MGVHGVNALDHVQWAEALRDWSLDEYHDGIELQVMASGYRSFRMSAMAICWMGKSQVHQNISNCTGAHRA